MYGTGALNDLDPNAECSNGHPRYRTYVRTSTRALRYVRLKDFYIFILLNVNTEWVVGIEVRDSDWCHTANALNVMRSLSLSLSLARSFDNVK